MSRELVESILAGDFVCANELFEEQLNILREQKLYEEKRRMAAKEKPFTQNTKADWAKYRKQNPSVKWDENKEGKKVAEKPKATPLGKGGKLSASDIKARRKAGYMQAAPALNALEFIKRVKKYKETGSLKEQLTPIAQQAKDIAASIPDNKPETPRDASAIKSPASEIKPELKRLKSKRAAMSTADRYKEALDRARNLEARGRAGSISKVKKMYRGHRAKTAIVTGAKKAWGAWGNTLRAGMSGPLEE